MAPASIDVSKLGKKAAEMRSNLIKLCGHEAEGLLESHYSSLIGSSAFPLQNLTLFPYFSNYLKLNLLELKLLSRYLDITKASFLRRTHRHPPHPNFIPQLRRPTANSKEAPIGTDILSRRGYNGGGWGTLARGYELVFFVLLVGVEWEQ